MCNVTCVSFWFGTKSSIFIFPFLSFSWWPFHHIFFVFCFAISPILCCKVIHPPFFPLVFLLPPRFFFPGKYPQKKIHIPFLLLQTPSNKEIQNSALRTTSRSSSLLCWYKLSPSRMTSSTLWIWGWEAGRPKWVVVYRDFGFEQPFLL